MLQLIPAPLEYLFLLAIYLLILLALFAEQVPQLCRSRAFWASAGVFGACWTALEIYGLRHHIWVYSEHQLSGLHLLTVPLEEYFAFLLIHLATCASWESLKRRTR